MNREVGKAVQRNTESYPEQKIKAGLHTEKKCCYARRCKDQEKEVVVLEPAFRLFVVMVFVQNPEWAVHNIFMGKPGDKFHKNKGCQHD
jgi:mitochondrial fission protein ELM1